MQSDWITAHGQFDDLAAFAVVARSGSYTRAAAELGMSTSMLSYTIKRLESRLRYPLLARNSRSVSPTAAGERLLASLEPALNEVGCALGEVGRSSSAVSGRVRLTATREAYETVVRPLLPAFLGRYPEASVEVMIEYGFRDIVANRFDAGIRLGEKLEKDMIALKAGPELRMSVVASPRYLADHPAPAVPHDLTDHRCINYRMASAGTLYAWEFERDGRAVDVAVTGPLTFNEPALMLQAALDGLGVAYLLEHVVVGHVEDGRLVALLPDWAAAFPGFYIYYPSRRQISPVFGAFLELVRETARGG